MVRGRHSRKVSYIEMGGQIGNGVCRGKLGVGDSVQSRVWM